MRNRELAGGSACPTPAAKTAGATKSAKPKLYA